jgi:adenine-specific DNA-methyltransferase
MVFDSNRACFASNESIFDIQNTAFDLVYLDVPYLNSEGKNETSNYLNCYHFLEGLVNYQNWEEMIDFDTRNLRFRNDKTKDFFNKENIYDSFETLIGKFSRSKIVISYKCGGIPSIDYIVKVMKRHKRKVYTRSQHYIYALNKQNGNAKKNKEVLIIGV